MKGITERIEGDKLILEIDLNGNFGVSSTGRSITIATTEGFQKIEARPGMSYSVNVNLPVRYAKQAQAKPASSQDDGIENIEV
ncbi:hypothetical protein [Castellaniella sp.]|uniref:hypothetical protein n=1 Tax=Castellaniella sp. TaxID=1955812 RepID=UPI002B0028E2|nr:hypothetical protein [Castellaniella sp.]